MPLSAVAIRFRFVAVIAALAASAFAEAAPPAATPGPAASTAGARVATTASAPAATAARAEPDALTRRAFIAAWDAARLRRDDSWRALAVGLPSYPLWPYVEHAVLVRDLRPESADAVDEFLIRHDGSYLADDLRARWLTLLAERKRWRAFVDAWRPRDSVALRCAFVEARLAVDPAADVGADARALWLTGHTLPAACDAMTAWLVRTQQLTSTLIWQRLVLAAEAREVKLMRALAARLPGAEKAEALKWARVIESPQTELAKISATKDARARAFMRIAIARFARRNPDAAGLAWPALAQRIAFDDGERARAIGAIALWKAANAKADAAAWMRQVPWDHAEDAVREWRVREALSRGTLGETAQALRTLSPTQQLDPRWRYLRARLFEIDGQTDAANAAFATLSVEPNFHGFLAAERAGRGAYALCGLEPARDPALRAKVAALPGLVRAFELFALERTLDARREWDHTVGSLPVAERAIAVDLAQQRGWLDRGPLTLLRPEEIRYYSLRFPLGLRDDVERVAKRHRIDPALVYGIIRSESAWVSDARSTADARGLMQLLPSIAPRLAKLEHQPYANANDLFKPRLNIALGTRHLGEVLARYDGRADLAAAAYNAGPRPVDRWLAQRGQLPVDLWLETIPYKETREYVSRVLAFAVIYDWRLHGDAASLATRLGLSRTTPTASSPRMAVHCPTPPRVPAPKADAKAPVTTP
jgi:soluble lytic murein transglycosylase